MSASCCPPEPPSVDPAYRRVLWIALVVNVAMFVLEIVAGWTAGSVSLLADAIDFFGDAANYGLSLAVLAMPLRVRSSAALVKAACMALFGAYVLGHTIWALRFGAPPQAVTMGVVACVALVANVGVALLLYRYREGDANMRSVWICSRNDAIGNLAVGLAAVGVFGTGSALPDLAVATVMATLALMGAVTVMKQARIELGPA